MKKMACMAAALVGLAAVCPMARAQAVVEYGLGAGRAATTTAPAQSAGKAAAGVFEKLNQAAETERSAVEPKPSPLKARKSPRAKPAAKPIEKNSTEDAAAAPATPAAAAPATPAAAAPATPAPTAPPAAPVYEDPKQIQAGLAYDEMVRRFGPPSMTAMGETGRTTVWYATRERTYQIEVAGGKVSSIQ